MRKFIVLILFCFTCCKSVNHKNFHFESKNGFYIIIDDDFEGDTITFCLGSDTILHRIPFPNRLNGPSYITIEEDKGILSVAFPDSEYAKIDFQESRNLEMKLYSRLGESMFNVNLKNGRFFYLIVFSYRAKERDEQVRSHVIHSFWQRVFGYKDKPSPGELLMNEDYKRFEVVRLLQSKNEPISD